MKYKAGVKERSSSLFHFLPETLHTQHVKEVTELQSEVLTCIIYCQLAAVTLFTLFINGDVAVLSF